ncbi:hypothetical protein THOM_0126 [Trachipleistophora hominis]|uniref:Uncharacterized protein n=1 Tax=Trachipleistophora hominis TaxID=72359 RepID=L7K0K2_TRAHO|nr:hypothetical protein THOM_0126 [Trachipleistophora hominis]
MLIGIGYENKDDLDMQEGILFEKEKFLKCVQETCKT